MAGTMCSYPVGCLVWGVPALEPTSIGWGQVPVLISQQDVSLQVSTPGYVRHQLLCPKREPEPSPASLEDPLRPAGRFGPGSCEVTTFVLGPGVHETLYASSKNGSRFPQVLWHFCYQAPLAFKAKCSGGSCSSYQTSQAGEPAMTSVLYSPIGEFLWQNNSPGCGLPTVGIWDSIISQVCPSYHLVVVSLCLDVEYLFW